VRINEDGTAQFQPEGSDETLTIEENGLDELFVTCDNNPEPLTVWKKFDNAAADRPTSQQ